TDTSKLGVRLDHFNDTVVLRLIITPGIRTDDRERYYLIFGRVVIFNADGDNQNATARLTTDDGKTELDRVDTRIAYGRGALLQPISLQGNLRGIRQDEVIVDLRCGTYAGAALQSSIWAVEVDYISPGRS